MSSTTPYTIIPNSVLNLDLSSGAIHLVLYMYSNSSKWEYHNHAVCKKLKISERTLTRLWKELLDKNVISRTRKTIDGRVVGGFEYEIILQSPKKEEKSDIPTEHKAKDLSDADDKCFESIWNSYSLGVYRDGTRRVEVKKKVKKLFMSLMKDKVSHDDIKVFIQDHYDAVEDKKYLRSLGTLLSDSETILEYIKEI